MSLQLLTITKEVAITKEDVFPFGDLDSIIRFNLGLDELDVYKILKMSQSSLDISNTNSPKMMMAISLIIDLED